MLILHEFMSENVRNPATVQGSTPSGAGEHGNTLREALKREATSLQHF